MGATSAGVRTREPFCRKGNVWRVARTGPSPGRYEFVPPGALTHSARTVIVYGTGRYTRLYLGDYCTVGGVRRLSYPGHSSYRTTAPLQL